jgi:hypothetical protein
MPKGRFGWIYENNPSGPPLVFLLRHDESNAIVGAISLFPRSAYLKGKPVPAWICGDLVVDQKHRALGPAMKLLNAGISESKQSGLGILIGFPNKKSEPVMKRAGFEVLSDLYEMTRVLSTHSYVKRYIQSSALSRTLSFPLDLLLRLRPSNMFQKKIKNYGIEMDDWKSVNIDNIWSRQLNLFSFIGERSSRYLEWRFMESPYAEHHVFSVGAKGAREPLGYIVFRRTGHRVQIVDIGFPGDEEALGILLSSFSRYQRSQGADSIALTLAGNPTLIEALRRNGYLVRSKEKKILIYVSTENEDTGGIKSGGWYLTSADNDI